MKAIIDILNSLEGIKALQNLNAEIYIVGGCVRDSFLKKESKDIDIIVRLLEQDIIIETLRPFGYVDCVGQTFGVIKFTPFGWTEEPIDIALPRIDILEDKTLGHHGIKAKFNPYISIEEDLMRRDCRLNSIAVSLDGKIIDPFGGIEDIKNKVISATSINSFSEDPLRMMRVIQFASRFGFSIEQETFNMIKNQAFDIKTITGERIQTELDKIFFKGDIQLGIKLFVESGLHAQLFEQNPMINVLSKNIITREDFYFTICSSSKKYLEVLKGEVEISKGIEAIIKTYTKPSCRGLFEAIQLNENVLRSGRVYTELKSFQQRFIDCEFPKRHRELEVGGNELMELGIFGKEIKMKQDFLLEEIFSGRVRNSKKDLLDLLNEKR